MERIRNLDETELEKNIVGINWEKVAKEVGGHRSSTDCFVRWISTESPLINKRLIFSFLFLCIFFL